MPNIACLNGHFLPLEEAMVSIEDRGFQFGDGVYEVIRVYGGRPFQLSHHLSRLVQSAQAISISLPMEAKEWEASGFVAWLYGYFPRICLAERPGGQITRYFPGVMPGTEFLEHIRKIDMPLSEAARLLGILERQGILWVVHRGTEILYVELRPTKKET